MMDENWVVVFEHAHLQKCRDRLLVLQSLSIPAEIVSNLGMHALVTPASFVEKAKYEIWQYDQENVAAPKPKPAFQPVHQNSLPGITVYVLIVCVVAWLAGKGAFGLDWLAAGRVDGELIRAGEWWRTLTALTLHGSLKHLMGNIGFGILFGFLAGSIVGSGVSWLAIVIASGFANALNTVLLESAHRSIGASTAVFAALGVVAGFSWKAQLMAQDRWAYRFGPIVGGIALLAFTGTGEAGSNTDIGAHLFGFVCGFAAGMLLTRVSTFLPDRRLQIVSGIAACGLIVAAWTRAFGLWAW
ncbi:MAG: rhomboid family intramembrane serine protease [Gammaproteobacteria bacterium]|nr:rhomboid family intramembrane serine protease [Gammaproteobacteria bacterium]